VIIGDNGNGKSTILRAIALGMCDVKTANALLLALPGELIRRGPEGKSAGVAKIRLTFTTGGARAKLHPIETRVRGTPQGELVERDPEMETAFPWSELFVAGYGASRGTRGTTARSSYDFQGSLVTLFDDRQSLLDPEGVLRDFLLRSFRVARLGRGRERGRTMVQAAAMGGTDLAAFERVEDILRKLWGLRAKDEIEVTSERVLIHEARGALPFHALGDGYRSTAGWVLDLLGSYLKAGRWRSDEPVTGVVLLDEIEEHLHPSWQRTIIPDLKKLLPKVQFIVTTHSPLAVVNTAPGEVFTTQIEDGKVQLASAPLPDPSGKTPNELLTDWFGASSILSDKAERLLGDYRAAVLEGDQAKVAELRRALEGQVDSFVTSPLDELALEIAVEARRQLRAAVSDEDRKRIVAEHAARLRARLAGDKS
jgi:hypothetical protein